MSTSVATFAAPGTPRRAGEDPLREAMENLIRALPSRTDAAVLVDLLGDDLREGLDALGDVECHFADVLDAMRMERPSPITLISVGEDQLILHRLADRGLELRVARRQPSERLHAACGFVEAGRVRGGGRKVGKWPRTLYMQRALGQGDATPPDVEPE